MKKRTNQIKNRKQLNFSWLSPVLAVLVLLLLISPQAPLTVMAGYQNFVAQLIGLAPGSTQSPWESITVTDSGWVGIGTDNPTKMLDVAGDINLSGDLYKEGVKIDLDKLQFRNTGTFGQKVGIGTDNPVSMLHLRAAADNGNNTPAIFFEKDTAPQGYWALGTFVNANKFSITQYSNTTSLLADRLVIDGRTGFVGIGTPSPRSKLQIDNGYLQLDVVSNPPSPADCRKREDAGRMIIVNKSSATGNRMRLYVCSGTTSGWTYVDLLSD